MNNEAREKIGFVKVGENGKLLRSFCTQCGTMLGGFQNNYCVFNRNAIYNKDGSVYRPVGRVNNVMRKHAFDPSKVPEPSHAYVPFGFFAAFVPLLMGFGGKKNANNVARLSKDLSKVEVVPITWE